MACTLSQRLRPRSERPRANACSRTAPRAHRRRAAGGGARQRQRRRVVARYRARAARPASHARGDLRCARRGLRRTEGIGPAKAAQLKAGVGAPAPGADRRSAAGFGADFARGGARLSAALARGAAARSVRRALPRQPASAARCRRALSRHARADVSVYPREVVKAALAHNAAAVIFAHNHPSGVAEPSRADELLTQSLKQALALVDIRTLDHFVVAGSRVVSFAERGLL